MSRKNVYFLPHGGGPLPVMGHAGHAALTLFLRDLEPRLAGVRALLLITAHWETDVVRFSGGAHPSMIFDYYGFPPEAYDYRYPAPGAPDLADKAAGLLAASGITAAVDPDRGFDHGTFIPMMLARPQADIPILQMSVLSSLDPVAHMAVGRALSPLLDEGVVMVGSGLTFHNLNAMLRGGAMTGMPDVQFDTWLNDTLTDPTPTTEARAARLTTWTQAPGARFCQPREDHLMPLFTCVGAAEAAGLTGRAVFRDRVMGFQTSGFHWTDA